MKHEYSYGAVVYRINDGRVEYLIENMKLGHVSIPKGHIEENETPSQCALREIKEETGLDVKLDTNFSHTIQYSPYEDVIKDVTFYCASFENGVLSAQIEEVASLIWCQYDEAMNKLTFKSDRETLRLANEYVNKLLANN